MMRLPNNTLLQGGKYKIIRFISAGGFGCTYEAEHVLLGKRVAIKEFFVKDFCNRDEATSHVTVGTQSKVALVSKLKKKFIEEASALSRFNHPNIVHVSDVFEENGTAYYVMDFIDGKSIHEILKTQPTIPEAQAVKYITQVAEALKQVHAQNRLHLDIKPGNIIIDSNDNAILIDFGASKQYDEVDGENTSTLVGRTPGYAPLEQLGNDIVKFMPATDIYALGATLYKMLSGKTPLSATLLASGEELDPLPSHISEETRNAVMACMTTNKNNRPQSIDAFLEMITDRTKDETSNNRCESEETKVDYAEPDKGTNTSPTPETTLKNHRTKPIKLKWFIVTIAVASFFIGCIIIIFNHSKIEYSESSKVENESSDPHSVSGSTDGHDYVDLGLSVKWATGNIGSKSPYAAGDVFGWGEITPGEDPIMVESKWHEIPVDSLIVQNVIDKNGNLTIKYDAAYHQWGGKWRTPTRDEIRELMDKCDWVWKENKDTCGYKIKGPNGNYIFLPAKRSFYHTEKFEYYWSATYNKDDGNTGYSLFLSPQEHSLQFNSCLFNGFQIRPVIE